MARLRGCRPVRVVKRRSRPGRLPVSMCGGRHGSPRWGHPPSCPVPAPPLPEAELEPVPGGAGAPARRGRGGLGLWRRGLLVGQGHGEGELGGLRLPEAGQEVRGDVLGPGAGAAAPLGFAPLVERHVPRAARAGAAVHGRGVGVVTVLLEALPEMAVHREASLRGHTGDTARKGREAAVAPALPGWAASPKPALGSGWKHGAPGT